MATWNSKDKYARIKNLKNELLTNLTSDSKKRKLGDDKADTAVLTPSVHTTPPSPTPSLEVTATTPPITCARGKSKTGMSVWDDPATALGRAHNVITNDELKGLSSIPSHELVSRHIHKLVQVCSSDLPVFLSQFTYTCRCAQFFLTLLVLVRSLGSHCTLRLII